MTKKILAFLTALLIMAASCALAEVDLSDYSITDATVMAVSHVDLMAPFSGTLCSFDWQVGDTVSGGEQLFSFLTTDVYAGVDGTLTELFTQKGEPTSFAMQAYGCLGSIEPTVSQRMNCTYEGANFDADKTVEIGQMLYFKSSKGDKPEGAGKVILRNGSGFVLEILQEKFDIGEKMTLFISPDRKEKENIGKGIVVQREPQLLNGIGVVCNLYVQEGMAVVKGQKLLSTVGAADAEPGAVPDVLSPGTGVIRQIAVVPGQQIWKGGLLARIDMTDELEIVAQVDEMDMFSLQVGDDAYVTLDTAAESVLKGTVTSISALGVTKANAAYYEIHVSLKGNVDMMLGQSASLYLPRN